MLEAFLHHKGSAQDEICKTLLNSKKFQSRSEGNVGGFSDRRHCEEARNGGVGESRQGTGGAPITTMTEVREE